jgi:hypothetical protein
MNSDEDTVERQKNKINKNNKNYQLKSVPNLNQKQQTDLVNNFPSLISSEEFIYRAFN